MFNTIGIISKPLDPVSRGTADELQLFLKEQGVGVVEGNLLIAEQADLIIVVGGDGSILNTARTFVDDNIPILGINLGRLGFLADVSVGQMFDIVTQVLEGEFTKEERCLLACQVEQDGQIIHQSVALNDAVINRQDVLKMIEFDVYIDDKFVNNQRADGLIITTPTGSTAYALSSGGPIMHPGVNAIGLVSICPHTMSHRPLLVPGGSEVVVRIKETSEGVSVHIDGQESFPVMPGQEVRVRQHGSFIHLLHPKDYDYFEIIRSKLHWGSKLT
ncbi:NAD(+) kinase [Candidatus Thioglobus sp.]|uniref:NAD(+) kinase n=1 Tax=Candidatus Thioglobus sp. TaxID=2026721 RepID=UPI003D0E37CB